MAGYSGSPLLKKLGLKDGMRAWLAGVPAECAEIGAFPGFSGIDLSVPEGAGRFYDYIHVFETDRAVLESLVPNLRATLRADGMLWISWPKKASKVPTTITEDVLREILLPTGLVDVKVAAIDDIWSGLKFVFRKELRFSL